MERLLTTSVERDDAEPVLLCSNTYDANGNMVMNQEIKNGLWKDINLINDKNEQKKLKEY